MMPVLLSNRSRRPTGTVTPTWFLGTLASISPGNLRALWLPTSADTTANISLSDLRVWTYDATIAGQISTQGQGVVVSFDGTNDYGSTPDTADLSFPEPQPFSIVSLANVTDTGNHRNILSKFASSGVGAEWNIAVTAADLLALNLFDDSVDKQPFRISSAAITMGALHLFGSSYDGGGGATAANGITLYQDGAVITSTASNQALYVAMEDGTSAVGLGVYSNLSATGRFQGSMGFTAVYAANLSLAQHAQIKAAVNTYYELNL